MKMIQLTMQITAKEITKITLGKYVFRFVFTMQ